MLVIATTAIASVLFTLVATTDHPHDAAPLHEAFYRALSLFAISAQGMPEASTESEASYVALWICYLLAPALTASFAADVINKLRAGFRTPRRAAASASNHVIVCGYGKHGRLLLERVMFRKGYEGAVVIDNDPAMEPFISVGGATRADTPVLRQDLSTDITGPLKHAAVGSAHMLVAATGNDVLNVAICLAAREIVGASGPHLLALISNEALADGLRGTLRDLDIRTRNTYRAAARNLLRMQLEIRPSSIPLALVIVGCGRFGTALAQAAQVMSVAARQIDHIGVVDLAAGKKINILRDTDQAQRLQPVGVQGDAEDPEILTRALAQCPEGARILVALCTDNDSTNLRLTFKVERQLRDTTAVLLTRTFDSPPESVRKVLTDRVEFFELHRLIANEIDEYLETLGAPADDGTQDDDTFKTS